MKTLSTFCAVVLLLSSHAAASAAELRALVPMLRQGGYDILFRHGATDESQKDVYPFKFDDMTAQRQLSEKGRDIARQIGATLQQLRIPIGEVYTSKLNRAVETGKLVSGKDVHPIDALTDSAGGSAAAMAKPTGGNVNAGVALRELVNAVPKAGTNTVLVTHKTNITDAFGKEASDVQEGEAFIYKPNGSAGPAELVARVKAADWASQTAN